LRQIASLLEPYPAQAGELDPGFLDVDGAGQPEGAQTLVATLEPWEADLAFMLSLLLKFHSPEEVLECTVQIPERFLGGALGDFVEPGQVGLLEGVQPAVEVYCGGRLARELVGFYLSGQAPVVCEARGSAVIRKQGTLSVVRFKLGLVGSLNFQYPSPPSPGDRARLIVFEPGYLAGEVLQLINR